MNDDLEKQLDEFYRKLDPSARRLEARWRSRTARAEARPGNGLWIGGGIAAAAAIILLVFALRQENEESPPPTVGKKSPAEQPVVVPRKEKGPEPKREEPKKEPDLTPKKDESRETPPKEEPKREKPKREEPKREPPKVDETQPGEKKPEEKIPTVERAIATLKETEGSFDVAGRKLRGKQKEVAVGTGDRLKSESVTKLTLAENRFLLLSAGTVVVFTPDKERLIVSLEQGEVLAELLGPGTNVRIATKACEIDHIGTVFSVRIDGERTIVMVEEGQVECRGAKGNATLKAGQQVVGVAGKDLSPVADADLKRLVWAHGHRPAERPLFAGDFSQQGQWQAEVSGGAAKALPDQDCAAKIRLEVDVNKPMFLVPVHGKISITYRAERAGIFTVQIWATELRMNFRVETTVRAGGWQTLTVDFDKFVPTDKAKKSVKLPVGAAITDLSLMFGDTGDKGTFWINSFSVIETRP